MSDWQLGQDTVDLRNEERMAANGRTTQPPKRRRYVIHNMHGPTVFQSDDIDEAYAKLRCLRGSNSGPYRLRDEVFDLEIAREE